MGSSILLLVGALSLGQVATPGKPVPPTPTPATPARDQKPATKGTSIIKGFVVDARTGRAMRRARVTASGPGGGGSAQSDAEGRFEIGELVAGKYSVSASKPGYLSSDDISLAKRPDPIPLGDNQTVEKVVLAISKGGVIAGNVLDEAGDPLPGAEVLALRYRYVDGKRQLTPYYGAMGGSTVVTDDLGAFRLYGLTPGDYYVSASGSRGMFSPFGPSAPTAEGPGPTYYPGTANAAEARRIVVHAGVESTGIVFPVTLVRLSRIRGIVQGVDPEAFVGGSVTVSLRDATGMGSTFGGPIRPDGSFEVANLPPGTYMLQARPSSPAGDQRGEIAATMISVNGEDLNGLVLVAGTGAIARGRVLTDEGAALPFPARTLRIFMYSADRGLPSFGGQASVEADGTFEAKRLLGQIRFGAFWPSPETSGDQWSLKSVLLDGRDVTDSGIDFQLGQIVEGIDLVFTRKQSKLTGQVQGSTVARNKIRVVVFPEDESKWTAPQSRYVRPGSLDPELRYTITLVPYDSYLVAAVTDLEDGQWTDPEFLRSVRDLAARVSINEGETKVQDLKIVEWRK